MWTRDLIYQIFVVPVINNGLGHGQCSANPRNHLLNTLDAEKCNLDYKMIDILVQAKNAQVKHWKKWTKHAANTADFDPEDENFEESELASESARNSNEEGSMVEKDVPNSEVCEDYFENRHI